MRPNVQFTPVRASENYMTEPGNVVQYREGGSRYLVVRISGGDKPVGLLSLNDRSNGRSRHQNKVYAYAIGGQRSFTDSYELVGRMSVTLD